VKIVREVTVVEIEAFLLQAGGGNHLDNLAMIRSFPRHFLISLSEADFWRLVFLQNDHVLPICPRGDDRTLLAVAGRALTIHDPHLSANWDIDEILARTRREVANKLPRPLVLRDARDAERWYGDWYIQDGSHSALGYASMILAREKEYHPVDAYCATSTLPSLAA
jgi:hypothetical protein